MLCLWVRYKLLTKVSKFWYRKQKKCSDAGACPSVGLTWVLSSKSSASVFDIERGCVRLSVCVYLCASENNKWRSALIASVRQLFKRKDFLNTFLYIIWRKRCHSCVGHVNRSLITTLVLDVVPCLSTPPWLARPTTSQAGSFGAGCPPTDVNKWEFTGL